MTTNEALLDAAIRHEIRVRGYSRATVRSIAGLLAKVDRDVVARLTARFAADPEMQSATSQRLDALLSEVRTMLRAATDEARQTTERAVAPLVEVEMDWQAGAINQASPVEFRVNRPSVDLVKAAALSQPFQGRLMREWFDDLGDAAFKQVRDVVRIGVVEGAGVARMAREIHGYLDGRTRQQAETIVRTAVNHVTTKARQAVYEANADIIKGVRWVSTLDGRTSAICRARDGQIYPPDSGPRPPAHPNCRSTTVPVVKSWKELGFAGLDEEAPLGSRPFVADNRRVKDIPKSERGDLIGDVPAETTYGDWLARQKRSFVEETMGREKATLFLDGKLPIDRFVDERTGREYTLDELRRREPGAFRRAAA